MHATYSLDRHDGLAKTQALHMHCTCTARAYTRTAYALHIRFAHRSRHARARTLQRFREVGLWKADPPAFAHGRFLAYNSTASAELQRARAAFAARGESAHNVAVHLAALRSHTAELRDVLALAAKLGRTVVLPRWACHCDRMWSGSDDIFHFGCMYPGAQDGNFLPFVCPMDHVLSPTEWQQVGQPYRDASWLGRALTPALTLALTLGLTLALTLSRRASRTETRPSSTACPAAALPRWLSSTTRPATRPAPPPSAPLA